MNIWQKQLLLKLLHLCWFKRIYAFISIQDHQIISPNMLYQFILPPTKVTGPVFPQPCQYIRVRSLAGESSGGGHGNPFRYSCLENPMDRGAWQAAVHMVAQSWVLLKWFSTHACMQASSETYQSNFEFYVIVELYDILSFIKYKPPSEVGSITPISYESNEMVNESLKSHI